LGSFTINFFLFLLAFLPLTAAYEGNRILFVLSQGQVESAIELYNDFVAAKGKHDFNLLQQMSLQILDQGFKSKEPEDQLMSIFGASVSMNDRTFYLLEEGLKSPYPQIQVAALNFISATQNDYAYDLINKLMGSPHAIIRLEAALQLAKSKHPKATSQIESLMQKVDPKAAPLFPQLFAIVGDNASLKILRKLMNNQNHEVRIASMLGAASNGRDDLLPEIRKLASQHDVRQQEAACLALGIFQDQYSEPILRKLSESVHGAVCVAALKALYMLGIKEAGFSLQKIALEGDPFAIETLGMIPGSEEVLFRLSRSSQVQCRLNATLSLLKLRDKRCLAGLLEILIRDPRDLAFAEIKTPGRGLKAWKAIPSAHHQGDEAAMLQELSLQFREDVLMLALELDEENFIFLANKIFESKQNDLIPLLVTLLINMDTEAAIALLKTQQQKAGAPLIRAYATLGLVKLKEEGPYIDHLKEWIVSQKDLDMMKFRTFVPFDIRDTTTSYELTPQENSKFLIDAIQVLAETQEQDSIDLLLQVLKEGHPRNRPVIAGLILRVAN
jgi:hypothetical protein